MWKVHGSYIGQEGVEASERVEKLTGRRKYKQG